MSAAPDNVMPIRPLNMFEAFWQAGFTRLVPVIPPDAKISEGSSLYSRVGTKQDARGKLPGVKGLDGTWHSYDWIAQPAPDARTLARWAAMGAGVGVKTGQGLVAIDADTTNEQWAALIAQEVEQRFGELATRIGNAPKAMYLIRVDESDGPVPYQRVEFGDRNDKGNLTERVELLTEGRFFVAEGIHPKTCKPYHWPGGRKRFDSIPVVSPAALTEFLDALKAQLPAAALVKTGGISDVDQDTLRGSIEHVRAAVEAIPNTSKLFPSRESYLDVGYAIKAALPDDELEALDIYQQWCDRWDGGENVSEIVESDWRRMQPPYRRGASWLYDMAAQHGNGKFNLAEPWFDVLPGEGESEESPFDTAAAKQAAEGQAAQEAAAARFRFESFVDVVSAGPATRKKPLVKGLLDAGTASVLYGDSNVGKTFVAMDLAFHIATGRPYCGMRTNRALAVYVAAEGGEGVRNRMRALTHKFAVEATNPPDFLLLPCPVDLRSDRGDTEILLNALKMVCKIEGGGSDAKNGDGVEGSPGGEGAAGGDGEAVRWPGLLVIDTLSRALAGGDENSPVDMGALVRNMDRLRAAAPGMHVLFIHHTGKDQARGARGHSLLRAAVDTEIEVSDGVVTVTKQRDLDKAWSGAFKLDVHTLGEDEDGDVITSCTVRHVGSVEVGADGKPVRARAATLEEEAVLAAVAALTDPDIRGGDTRAPGAKTADIVTAMQANEAKLSENTARRRIERIAARGWIRNATRGRWELTEAGELLVAGHADDLSGKGVFE